MFNLSEPQRQTVNIGLVARCIAGAGVALNLGVTTALAQNCAADRTPLEMAGRTLCLITAAMPSIFKHENGEIYGLIRDGFDDLPLAVAMPNGSFYLNVEKGLFSPPALERTQDSELPGVRQINDGRMTYMYPQGVTLDGQEFELQCHAALSPIRETPGAQDCQINAALANGIRVKVYLATGIWGDVPAWPLLDEHLADTWPAYQAGLESGINKLLSIQG